MRNRRLLDQLPVDRLTKVGFWAPKQSEPSALEDALEALVDLFDLSGLPRVEDYIDRSWDGSERSVVLSYLTDRSYRSTGYLGYSSCRICGCDNGTADFADGTYVWPEGFGHYIAEHSVVPPKHFVDHVMRRVGKP